VLIQVTLHGVEPLIPQPGFLVAGLLVLFLWQILDDVYGGSWFLEVVVVGSLKRFQSIVLDLTKSSQGLRAIGLYHQAGGLIGNYGSFLRGWVCVCPGWSP
jgi:hypothetical protein